MTPFEYGQEIARFGLARGVEQFSRYEKTGSSSVEDAHLIEEAGRNPGMAQLLFADLITGAFFCHAKVLLKSPDEVLGAIGAGVFAQLPVLLPGLGEQLFGNHVRLTANFATDVEREITQIEEDLSVNLMFRYRNSYYL